MKVFVNTSAVTCARRLLDGARFRRYFEVNGCEVVYSPFGADVAVVVGCIIGDGKIDRAVSEVKQAENSVPRVFAIGCLPSLEGTGAYDLRSTMIPVSRYSDIDFYFPDFETKFDAVSDESSSLGFENEMGIGYLRIGEGCLSHCTYCNIRSATGSLRSKPLDTCVEEYRKLAKRYECVRFDSENLGQYGLDTGSSLLELLTACAAADPQHRRPSWSLGALDVCDAHAMLPSLLGWMSRGRIWHISCPIQSAVPRILKLMGRDASLQKIEDVFSAFDANSSDVVGTHVIVGFPSETEDEAVESMNFVLRHKINKLHLLAFHEFPNAPAAKMGGKLPPTVCKERLVRMTKMLSPKFLLDVLTAEFIIAHKRDPVPKGHVGI